VAAVAGLSCTDRAPERVVPAAGPVVARVNDAVLREDDLKDALPDFLGDIYTDGGRNEFVEQWVEGELLYQKALEEGLQRDEEIRRKVDQFEHMLMQQEVLRRFLEREITVTDEEITRYYEENIEGFRRETDEFQVARLVFPEEETAREVAGELEAAPERFDELIASEAYAGRMMLQDLGRYAASEMEGMFGNGRGDLRVGDLSPPVVAGPGNCYVLRVMAVLEEGSVRERDEVADRIRGILLRRKGEEARRAWIEELKRSADVEIAEEYGG
jgi:hypothetical protein